jgi:hypothetical protein
LYTFSFVSPIGSRINSPPSYPVNNWRDDYSPTGMQLRCRLDRDLGPQAIDSSPVIMWLAILLNNGIPLRTRIFLFGVCHFLGSIVLPLIATFCHSRSRCAARHRRGHIKVMAAIRRAKVRRPSVVSFVWQGASRRTLGRHPLTAAVHMAARLKNVFQIMVRVLVGLADGYDFLGRL